MTSGVMPIPEGYHSVIPYLIVNDAAGAIAFDKQAFGATEGMRMPAGRPRRAQDRRFEGHVGGRVSGDGRYVDDVDAVTKRSLAAGATEVRPVKDEFYGDRLGTVEDPFGHLCHVCSHKEDLSADELKRRAEKAMAQAAAELPLQRCSQMEGLGARQVLVLEARKGAAAT